MKKLLLTLSLAFLFTTGAISQTNPPDLNGAISNLHYLIAEFNKEKAAQNTNAPVVYYNAQGVPIATNTPASNDTGSNIERYGKTILSIIGGILALGAQIMVAARWLRKALPDSAQTGMAGQVLRHVASEVNPPKPETLKENPTTNLAPPAPPVPPKE